MRVSDHIWDALASGFGVGVAAGWTWRHFHALSPAGGTVLLLLWIAALVAVFTFTWRSA